MCAGHKKTPMVEYLETILEKLILQRTFLFFSLNLQLWMDISVWRLKRTIMMDCRTLLNISSSLVCTGLSRLYCSYHKNYIKSIYLRKLASKCNLKYIWGCTVHTYRTVPSNRIERTLPHCFDLYPAVMLNAPPNYRF